MSGFLQTVFYVGYNLLICLGLGLMCGTVGLVAAQAFVRSIYSRIKLD